jgi:hypothetical protein
MVKEKSIINSAIKKSDRFKDLSLFPEFHNCLKLSLPPFEFSLVSCPSKLFVNVLISINGLKVSQSITGIRANKSPRAENVQYVYLMRTGVVEYRNPQSSFNQSFLKNRDESKYAEKKLKIPINIERSKIECVMLRPDSCENDESKKGAADGYENG